MCVSFLFLSWGGGGCGCGREGKACYRILVIARCCVTRWLGRKRKIYIYIYIYNIQSCRNSIANSKHVIVIGNKL